ncbi:MAG TPA: ABC transporter permease [Chthonomonadales bacterium]|nr:ABC transporter permease [Chthonomonadales bacterium]
MGEELAELWRFRGLLGQLVKRELKVRYKNSVAGFLWSIVPPVLQVVVFSFLWRDVMRMHAKNISAYMLAGIIPWTYFANATLDSSMSLLLYYPVIKKVYMPREVIPLAYVISNVVHFLLGWVVFFVAFFVVFRLGGIVIPIQRTTVYFPIITMVEIVLVTGVALWVSALNIFYEDVKFIVQTGFNLLFFLLPVLYPADVARYSHTFMAHPWLYRIYMLNPITAVIDAYRKTLLQPMPPGSFNQSPANPPVPMDWMNFAGAAVISLIVLYSGYWYFNRRKWLFVERK